MKFALLAVASLTALAGDWPRFRGPNGTGVGEGNPPAAIGPSQNVAWRVSPPAGKSSPVVFGGQVAPHQKAEMRDALLAANPRLAFLQGLSGIPGLIVDQIEASGTAGVPIPGQAPV